MSTAASEPNFDPFSEHLLSLSEAAAVMPGRPVCRQTVYRWAFRGIRGIKLETWTVGGGRHTSREAIGRFLAALNAPSSSDVAAPITTNDC